MRLEKSVWLVSSLLSVLSITIVIVLFSQAYFPIMLNDEWADAGYYFSRVTVASIFCSHNGHVYPITVTFTRLLQLLVAGDPFWRSISSITAAFAWGLIVAGVSIRSRSAVDRILSIRNVAIILLLVSIAVSTAGFEQLFWGFGIQPHFAILFGILSLLSADIALDGYKKRHLAMACAIIFALLSTFSHTYGAAVWGGLGLLFLLYRKPIPVAFLLLFSGLCITVFARKSAPPCSPENFPFTEDIPVAPLLFLRATAAMTGSAVVRSITPILEPSTDIAGLFGISGISFLGVLTWLYSFHRPTPRIYLIIASAWFAVGMMALVCFGRLGIIEGYPAQTIAGRFVPLSILFWACLAGLTIKSLGNCSTQGSVAAALISVTLAIFLLVSNLVHVPWTTSFRPEQVYLSATELRAIAIRLWVIDSDKAVSHSAKILSYVNPAWMTRTFDNVKKHRWDSFHQLPDASFPPALDPEALSKTTGNSHLLTLGKASKTRGFDSWLIRGSISPDVSPDLRHIYIQQGAQISGYAIPSHFLPFTTVQLPQEARLGARLLDYLEDAFRRLHSILGRKAYWFGISNARLHDGQALICREINPETLLCRAGV